MSFSRVLLTASAAVLGVAGLAATFLPDDILRWSGVPATPPLVLAVEVMGGLYMGFAMLNWMARHTVVGGIYGRPVVMANLLHFVPVALPAARLVAFTPGARYLWPVALVYAAFAIGFVLLVGRDPFPASTSAPSRG